MDNDIANLISKKADDLKRNKTTEGYVRAISLDGVGFSEVEEKIAKRINVNDYFVSSYMGHDYTGWKALVVKVIAKVYDERGLIVIFDDCKEEE